MLLFDNPYRDLFVGLTPRRHPGAATLGGIGVAIGGSIAAFLALLCVAPIHDPFTRGHPVLMPAQIWRLAVWHDLDLPIGLRLGCALLIGLCVGLYAAYRIWTQTAPTEPFRQIDPADPKIYWGDLARMRLQQAFRDEGGRTTEPGLWLAPHLAIPRPLEARNIMILGVPGSGKSNLCRALCRSAIDRGDRLVLHCAKGDVTSAFRRQDVILISPTHQDSWAWDLGADIDGPAAAAEFARDVIPASAQPFWSDTARLVLTDVIISVQEENGANWDARTLLEYLLAAPQDIQARIAGQDLSASPLLGPEGAEEVSRTVEGVMTTLLSGALTTLRPLARAWSRQPRERRVSLKRFLSPDWTGPGVLIVQTNPDFEQLSTAVCGGVLKRICARVTSPAFKAGKPRVTIVLDEFYKLGRLEGFVKSLSVGREKGLVVVLALQSVWQLREHYGEGAEALSDLFQIKVYGRHAAGEGAQDAARRLGTRKIRGSELNRHSSQTNAGRLKPLEIELPVFSETQLQSEVGLFFPGTPAEVVRAVLHYAGTAYRLDWPPTRWQRQSQGYVPAPWTRGPLRPAAEPGEPRAPETRSDRG
jgi:hypothetical protein